MNANTIIINLYYYYNIYIYFLYFYMINKQMDTCHCLIRLQKNKSIALLLFQNNIVSYNYRIYPICFTASSAYLVYSLLSKHDFFKEFSISHILYIGKELYKAELSLILNQIYVQN